MEAASKPKLKSCMKKSRFTDESLSREGTPELQNSSMGVERQGILKRGSRKTKKTVRVRRHDSVILPENVESANVEHQRTLLMDNFVESFETPIEVDAIDAVDDAPADADANHATANHACYC